jgi:hypothetical protein
MVLIAALVARSTINFVTAHKNAEILDNVYLRNGETDRKRSKYYQWKMTSPERIVSEILLAAIP